MEQLQILVATMNQTDLSLVDKMNLRCSAIIANQTDREEVRAESGAYGAVKMISTTTVGVGKNRNIAILASEAELLLFADDDVIYHDDAADHVKEAFRTHPEADVIIFSMDYTRNGEIIERRHLQTRRVHLWNSMRYGACALAIRRKALLKANLSFSQLFGGGCPFGSGEDSLFLRDCFRENLNVYTHSCVLGTCSRDQSSWFRGYNEKYFYDRGVLLRFLFPRTKYLMLLRFSIFFRKPTTVPMRKRFVWMYSGMKAGKNLRPYTDNTSGDQ